MSISEAPKTEPWDPLAEQGRLYVEWTCAAHGGFMVHITRKTFTDPAAMMRLRPACPTCGKTGKFGGPGLTPRVFGAFDGGLCRSKPVIEPEEPAPDDGPCVPYGKKSA